MAGLNLLDMISQTNNGQGLSQIAQQFGLSEDQAQSAVAALLPALSSGLKRNVGQEGGLQSLMGALQNGSHAKFLDQPERLSEPDTLMEGNAILGHLLGSKDVSRAAVSRAAEKTGLTEGLLKQILPIVATMVMSALSKQSQDSGIGGMIAGALAGNAPQGGASTGGGLLGGLMKSALGGSSASSNSPLGGLGNLLDADGDGSGMDDIFDMLSKR